MRQFSVGFMIPVIIGAIAGSALGAGYTNILMSLAMKGGGIMRANFLVQPFWIAGFCVATILFSYALSLLVTWRIRKISAYALVTE
jgi:putative ABC transport system permease protein